MATRDFGVVRSGLRESAAEVAPAAQQHVRTLEEQLEAIQRGDFDSVLEHAHADVTLEIFAPPEFTWIRRANGLAELRAAMVQNFEAVGDQRPELRDIFAERDTVILFGRERGVNRATGTPYDLEFVERFTFRDQRLAAVRIVAAYAGSK